MYIAITKGSGEIVQLLLNSADINLNQKLIQKVNFFNSVSKKKIFLNNVFFGEFYNESYLHVAAHNNDCEVMKLLVSKDKIDVNSKNILIQFFQ